MRRIQTAVATFVTLITLAACTDAPTAAAPAETSPVQASVEGRHHSSTPTSSVRWNRKAMTFFRARGGNAGRVNAYVSIGQYRAVRAALRAQTRREHPSLAGAAAGASVVLLKQFYPLDAAAIDAELEAQRAAPAGDDDEDDVAEFDAGVAIGRVVGAAVVSQAATDNFGLTDPGVPPVGAGRWVSSGAPIVRGGLGARPFFLRSQSELRSSPPPAFGSAAYLTALGEVKSIALSRTPEQVAIVRKWVPFSGVVMNGVAADLIDRYRRSELEAAAIFAYSNAAAYDAIVACFDTKYAYWFIRPTQADATITLATGLPNHPSYPSAHSCETGAWQGILTIAFPRDRAMLDATAQEASMSRVYGGLHYRFDGEAGLSIGRRAALLALLRRGIE